MIQVHDIEQGTEEWHELRAGKYTGSNAHKLLKYGARPHSLTEQGDFNGNFWTKRGHLLEDEAIELYQQIKGEVGIRMPSGRKAGFVTNDRFPMCGYSPDDLYPDYTIEVKAFDEPKHLELWHGEIPLEVLAQLHFGMAICEKNLAKLLIYCPRIKDPKLAFKIIEVRAKRAIHSNFKRILRTGVAV